MQVAAKFEEAIQSGVDVLLTTGAGIAKWTASLLLVRSSSFTSFWAVCGFHEQEAQ